MKFSHILAAVLLLLSGITFILGLNFIDEQQIRAFTYFGLSGGLLIAAVTAIAMLGKDVRR